MQPPREYLLVVKPSIAQATATTLVSNSSMSTFPSLQQVYMLAAGVIASQGNGQYP
jgi:hypothetical protein